MAGNWKRRNSADPRQCFILLFSCFGKHQSRGIAMIRKKKKCMRSMIGQHPPPPPCALPPLFPHSFQFQLAPPRFPSGPIHPVPLPTPFALGLCTLSLIVHHPAFFSFFCLSSQLVGVIRLLSLLNVNIVRSKLELTAYIYIIWLF